jgi:DNA-binding beta-propeller fold protein YncE
MWRLLVLVLVAPLSPCARAAAAPPAPPAGARDTIAARSAGETLAAPADTLPLRLAVRQVLGFAEAGRGALVEPGGVAVDAFGRIYVTDAAQHRLVRYDAQGAWLGEAGTLGSGPGELRRPSGATAVGSLGVAVLDRENQRVVLYDLFGRLVGTLADLAALEEDLGRVDALALAADRGGALYVADADRDRVLVLDFSGRYIRTLGGYGPGAGSFRGLAGLGVAPRGELVTAERVGARVQRLDAGGRALASWALAVRPGRGRLPVAVDDSSRVAVADEATGRLWVFDEAGRLLAMRADLAGPRGLTFAPDRSLLVAEGASGRVRRFALLPAEPPAPSGR